MAIAAIGVQALLSYFLIRSAKESICLTSFFVLIWNIMFTLRLIQISIGPNPLVDHPIVVGASHYAISIIWILTTLAFVGFAIGGFVARRLIPRGSLKSVALSRQRISVLLVAFIGGYMILALTHANSGILVNVAEFYLFGIAFAAHQSETRGRPLGVELLAVVAAGFAAILFGFKEVAVLAVIAWVIGRFSARRRIITLTSLGVALLGLLFYIGIQSQRDAALFGEPTDFVTATMRGLKEYDFPTGLRRHKTGIDIPINVVSAVASRARGADSLFVLQARLPGSVGFLAGRSLWQPVVSSVPGLQGLVSIDFPQLSLGRYFNQTFWSLRPAEDVSSQPLTVPGDFYLNFGVVGVFVGMAAVGFMFTLIDRRCPVRSATSAGLFAYAAVPLLSIERNVAYLAVTGLIRYSLGLLLIAALNNVVLRGSGAVRPSRGRQRGGYFGRPDAKSDVCVYLPSLKDTPH
ncbi:MAG: hypothetical protein M3256_07570 [Actinomycetota bacterium]|nr:hypothetical protein [Actinomycetota bacterium]